MSARISFSGLWLLIGLAGGLALQAVGSSTSHRSTPVARASITRVQKQVPRLSLASIFSPKAANLTAFDRKKLRTIIATGDVIPGRSVNYKMVTYNDFLYPFRRTAPYLRTGDVTVVNLESPLIQGCPLTDQGFTFCGDPRAVQGLRYAGIDVACTSNNHITNYGFQGVRETWRHLRAARIGVCGLGQTDYVNVRGLRFAFLAYNCVGERFDYALARREIRAAKRTGAVVIVSVHWGKEYVPIPETEPGIADDNPRKVGHWIIDSGADFIIGNHPHHVQAVEIYRGHLITYAHGNFAFDQMFRDDVRSGVVGTYTFYGHRLISARYRPVFIYDYAQPRWADPARGRQIMAGMRTASYRLARMRL